MITINIEHSTSAAARERIEQYLEREFAYDPNLNGATYQICSDDFCCVDGADEIIGCQLLRGVQNAIFG